MICRNQQEQPKILEEIRQNFPIKPKSTPEMLNYKKILGHLAKQGEFAEAHKIKKLLEELEERERQSANMAREHKINLISNQINQRHSAELAALQKRIDTGREELLKAKKLESDK